jgi:hypothetical protein
VDPRIIASQSAEQATERGIEQYYQQLKVQQDDAYNANQMASSLQRLDRPTLAKTVLGSNNLDVQFLGRYDWETRLFEQTKAYIAALRAAEKALRAHQEFLSAIQYSPNPTKGDEMKHNQLEKEATQAVENANRESSKCMQLAQEGWNRAQEFAKR